MESGLNKRKNFDVESGRETQTQAIHEVFKEFCSKSSIHGMRYFTEPRRHWSERLWWIIAFGLSVFLCGFSIYTIGMKWYKNPITMGLTDKPVPISEIPFPVITICPNTKSISEKFNITATYQAISLSKNLSADESLRMEVLMHICQFMFHEGIRIDKETTNNGSIYDIIEDLAPQLNDTLFNCRFKGKQLDSCSLFFSPVLTEDGLCFAFNSLNSRDIYTDRMAPEMMTIKNNPNISGWNADDGYANGFNKTDYPIRVFNSKPVSGLTVLMKTLERDLNYLCQGGVQGYKVFLSPPGEVLRSPRYTAPVPLSELAVVAIKPTLFISSKALRSYDPIKRQCFFNSERQLSFLRFYTQRNCEAECLANFTLKECGCVKFSMPREKGTKICGGAKFNCYEDAEEKLFGEDVIEGLTDEAAKSFRIQCNCLPACTSIVFDADVHKVKFDWISTLHSYGAQHQLEEFVGTQPSGVLVFFRDYNVVTLKRSVLYTYTDFFAIVGGLLGLFLGVSLLSVVEFVYFSTLRLFWTLQQWKSNNTIVPFKRRPTSGFPVDTHDFHDKE